MPEILGGLGSALYGVASPDRGVVAWLVHDGGACQAAQISRIGMVETPGATPIQRLRGSWDQSSRPRERERVGGKKKKKASATDSMPPRRVFRSVPFRSVACFDDAPRADRSVASGTVLAHQLRPRTGRAGRQRRSILEASERNHGPCYDPDGRELTPSCTRPSFRAAGDSGGVRGLKITTENEKNVTK